MSAEVQRLVRIAARALGRAGLVHAYGHCSARLDANSFLVCAAKPMGLITAQDTGTIVKLDAPLPEGVLGEVRIHREIYRRRSDVGGICRTMPPHAMALAAFGKTPQPRHGFGCYFGDSVRLWDDIQLLRDDAQAAALADQLGAQVALLMRGNGAVVTGATLERAVGLTWYLEDACRLELEALRCGLADDAPTISSADAQRRATDKGQIFERMWQYLTHADPESSSL